MTDPAGKLHIRIGPEGTAIRSTRPVRAAAVFVGRATAQTAELLPALFGICATAQSAACAGALEQAAGLVPDPRTDARRARMVEIETLREHLWRILLDWPRLGGEAPDGQSAAVREMAEVMGHFGALRMALAGTAGIWRPGARATAPDRPAAGRAAAGLAGLVARLVLGEPAADWLDRVDGHAGLCRWAARGETAAARLVARTLESDHADLGRAPIEPLPPLADRDLHARLAGPEGDAFVALPTWAGTPRETSPLTRNLGRPLVGDLAGRFGNGLLTRIAAQLAELARLTADLEAPGPIPPGPGAWAGPESGPFPGLALGPGLGLAQVQAARGLLVHQVRLLDDRVADYRVLAPTEWTFHPQGAVAVGLADLASRVPAPAELLPLARLFVAVVDPCVDYELELAPGPGVRA